MKGYKDYIKTNSNFIPEVPLNWKKLRVKNLVDKNTYYPVGDGDHGSIKPEMYLEEGVPYIRVQNLSWHGDLLLDNVVYISDEVQKANSKSILRPGDILIAKTGATIGKLGLVPKELKEANTTSSVGKLTIDLSRFHPKYILYSFQAKHFNDQIWIQASQKSAQPGFNIDDLIEFEIATPVLEEQTKIAAFLDYKTSLIDETIEKKKRLIELLKEKRQAVINEAVTKGLNPIAPMKDSGVEWLGEIPEHWELSYFKHYLSLKGRLGWKGLKAEEYVENSGYGFLSTPDIKNDDIDYYSINNITEERYLESPEIMLQKGDVLLVKDGSTLGITNIVKELPIKTTVNSSIGVLRVFDEGELLSNYLLIYLRSNLMQSIINQLKAGQGVPHLFQKDIKNFILIVPPIIEQNIIVEKIIKSDEEIKLLISSIELAIEKLQTYRQSLISEAVTGKIDVRDWERTKN